MANTKKIDLSVVDPEHLFKMHHPSIMSKYLKSININCSIVESEEKCKPDSINLIVCEKRKHHFKNGVYAIKKGNLNFDKEDNMFYRHNSQDFADTCKRILYNPKTHDNKKYTPKQAKKLLGVLYPDIFIGIFNNRTRLTPRNNYLTILHEVDHPDRIHRIDYYDADNRIVRIFSN